MGNPGCPSGRSSLSSSSTIVSNIIRPAAAALHVETKSSVLSSSSNTSPYPLVAAAPTQPAGPTERLFDAARVRKQPDHSFRLERRELLVVADQQPSVRQQQRRHQFDARCFACFLHDGPVELRPFVDESFQITPNWLTRIRCWPTAAATLRTPCQTACLRPLADRLLPTCRTDPPASRADPGVQTGPTRSSKDRLGSPETGALDRMAPLALGDPSGDTSR